MSKNTEVVHTPVLLKELVDYLNILPDGTYLDCTGGGGGHAAAILSQLDDGKLFIMDRDEEACERLHKMFSGDSRVEIINDNFGNIQQYNFSSLNGLYADFGLSLYQLTDPKRGFSFRSDALLDMRMDKRSTLTAYDVINDFPQETLANILTKYGEEPFARKIAFNIVKYRALRKIKTTKELADIISKSIPMKFHRQGINPATRSFQAIRIFVNKELESIESLLKSLESVMASKGRVVFISFHSLEDRLVKDFLHVLQQELYMPSWSTYMYMW